MSNLSRSERTETTLGEALDELNDSMSAFGDRIGAVNSALADLEAVTGRCGETAGGGLPATGDASARTAAAVSGTDSVAGAAADRVGVADD